MSPSRILIVLTAALLFSSACYGLVLRQGTSRTLTENKKPWFTVTDRENPTEDGLQFEVTFKDGEGQVLSVEKFAVTKDFILRSYEWVQNQTHEQAKMVLTDKKLTMNYSMAGKNSDPKFATLSDKEVRQLVVPPMLAPFMKAHWDEMVAKGRIDVLIAVPNMQDTFRFHISKGDSSDPHQFVWVLRATSLFVRMAVSPVDFVFNDKHETILAKGVAPPVRFKESSGRLVEKKSDIAFETLPNPAAL
jgi:hypothetical protein